MLNLSTLFVEPDSPKILVGNERLIDTFIDQNKGVIRDQNVVLRVLRGQRCKDECTTLQEWAAALQFPYYFGNNWDAFEECINDLDWLRAERYVFIVTNSDRVPNPILRVMSAVLERAQHNWLQAVESSADYRWTNNPIPFMAAYHCPQDAAGELYPKLPRSTITIQLDE